jgi:hypothetical protein
MKIQFEDKSSVEARRIDGDKVLIIISAQDQENPLKKITNAAELTDEEFKRLISDV